MMPDTHAAALVRIEAKLDHLLGIIDRYERLLAPQNAAIAWGIQRKARKAMTTAGADTEPQGG